MSENVEQAVREAIERIEPKRDLVAVIPAGGLGGQMYPVTSGMPKALLPVGTKPLLINILEQLDKSGVFKKCIIACNEWHPMIKEFVGVFSGEMKMQCECMKTADVPPACLRQLRTQGKLSDPFLLHYCDILIEDMDWTWALKNYEYWRQRKSTIGMLMVSRCFSYSVGIVSVSPKWNLVEAFEQKPHNLVNGYANCAVAFLSTEFVEKHVGNGDPDIFDAAMSKALGTSKLASFEIGEWQHFQQIRDWLRAQHRHYQHIPY